MHSGVQTVDVTTISYKPLSGLNFARCTGQLHALFSFGVYKPLSMVDKWFFDPHILVSASPERNIGIGPNLH